MNKAKTRVILAALWGAFLAVMLWAVAANGFVAATPTSMYGDGYQDTETTTMRAQRFTVPGSGLKQITEVGVYSCNTGNLKIAIYTDDAVNTCPETFVTNSESPAAASSAVFPTHTKVYATYVTKPQVTGGTAYWLAISQSATLNYSKYTSGGTGVGKTGQTYGVWPSGSAWETHVDSSVDFSFYAVYEAATTSPTGGLMLIWGKEKDR